MSNIEFLIFSYIESPKLLGQYWLWNFKLGIANSELLLCIISKVFPVIFELE